MIICQQCHRTFGSTSWVCPECGHAPTQIQGFSSFAPALAHGTESFPEEGYAQLASLEAKNFWFRSRNRVISWALQKYFPNVSAFLEIGCGTGFVLSGIRDACPALTLWGSEIHVSGLSYARRRVPTAKLFQMDACAMPFEAEFDVIGCFDVLEHVKEDQKVLDQMFRSLRKEGGILLTVPQHPWLWSAVDDYSGHVRRYRASEMRERVESAGFAIVRMTSFVSLLLPLMILSRKKRVKQDDPTAELTLSRPLNTVLEWVLIIERIFIKAGLNLPWGGSLLIIANKPRS